MINAFQTVNYTVDEIRDVEIFEKARLVMSGIRNTRELLARCALPAGRERLSRETGLCEDRLLSWAHAADLVHIPGLGPQFIGMLKEAGVDAVEKLKQQDAENIRSRFIELNRRRTFPLPLPTVESIRGWIDDAKNRLPFVA